MVIETLMAALPAIGSSLPGIGSFASSIIGGLGGIAGAQASNKAAMAALDAKNRAQFEMDRQAQRQYELMSQMLQREREIADYYRATNDRNAALALDQRDYERGMSDTNFGLAREDRAYMMDRQQMLDRTAAERRAFDLQQLLRNQNLSNQERQTALSEMRRAQAIARGERDFSIDELRRAQALRDQERAFDIDRQERAYRIAEEERAISMQDRDRILGRTGQMYDDLQAARGEMGDIAPTRQFTEADIDGEAQRRAGIYGSAVDRAVDRIASVNEAGLIRRGVDRSSTGDAARSTIAERVAPLYEDAYRRAADDALRYITGMQGTLYAGADQEMERRSRALAEITGIYGAPLQFESRLPELRSAQGPIMNIGSAVYDRNVSSANDYRVPLQVGSAIYEPRNMDAGVGGNLGLIEARYAPARSSGINPVFAQLPFSQPANFASGGNYLTMMGSRMAGDTFNTLYGGAQTSARGAGTGFQNLLERGSSAIGSLLGGIGSSGAGTGMFYGSGPSFSDASGGGYLF